MSSVSGGIDGIGAVFDDGSLVADAGLLLAGTVMSRLGLEALIDDTVRPGGSAGSGAGRKVLSLVASMLVGGRCIDDVQRLRSGSAAAVLPFAVVAPFGHPQAQCQLRIWSHQGSLTRPRSTRLHHRGRQRRRAHRPPTRHDRVGSAVPTVGIGAGPAPPERLACQDGCLRMPPLVPQLSGRVAMRWRKVAVWALVAGLWGQNESSAQPVVMAWVFIHATAAA